jgi:hypothetical protein
VSQFSNLKNEISKIIKTRVLLRMPYETNLGTWGTHENTIKTHWEQEKKNKESL